MKGGLVYVVLDLHNGAATAVVDVYDALYQARDKFPEYEFYLAPYTDSVWNSQPYRYCIIRKTVK